jgi:hypothetical protein
VPECRSAGVPECRSAGVPECRSVKVQKVLEESLRGLAAAENLFSPERFPGMLGSYFVSAMLVRPLRTGVRRKTYRDLVDSCPWQERRNRR